MIERILHNLFMNTPTPYVIAPPTTATIAAEGIPPTRNPISPSASTGQYKLVGIFIPAAAGCIEQVDRK
ncbi:hypothetical protein [Haladaptatus salinisoli]|uniref:hypothetical protein n=1 Tax=Haladaptatus salinisoli TaxID=2884876 RepID=UPI001D0ADA8A|nr:hypothetical protein [Haladaptatus salinisoli]